LVEYVATVDSSLSTGWVVLFGLALNAQLGGVVTGPCSGATAVNNFWLGGGDSCFCVHKCVNAAGTYLPPLLTGYVPRLAR